MSSDSAKSRAAARPRLDWQGELDSYLRDLDSRLTHPRRRATDSGQQPTLPELGTVAVTSELLDEIAWRVAEQIRRNMPETPARPPASAPPQHPLPPRQRETGECGVQCGLRPGKMLMIRYQLPRLPWLFRLLQRRRRKKQHPLTTVRLRA